MPDKKNDKTPADCCTAASGIGLNDDYHHQDATFRLDKDVSDFLKLSYALPKDVVDDVTALYHKEKEGFLSEHFKFAKQYLEIRHKIDLLKLEIKEHVHTNPTKVDKQVISEALDSFKRLKDEIGDLTQKERQRAYKFERDLEHKVHAKIQAYLKK